MSVVDNHFKRLGFNVGIPSLVFVRSLSRDCMLVVEGERVKGFAEYRYTFYKTRYLPDGRMTSLKVYMENQSIKRVLHRVASFLSFLERTKQIEQKECEKVAQ
ncbi:hypothetical protein N1207_02755 [Bacillus subtilis]|uniref:hypothetical protein n=1 Tax=Bacillus subtilis group TaxID=653685 RepID=UPI0021A35015|nr:MULTISPECIES: hypothetical protein [Bacillus subtilis group]MCY8171747.1 hypothetical protein [Bacillus inaquosorum]MCY8357589.1 hypothetical protein [Bacillus inaquosorum]MEC1737610.1 hypothetical protein [Bacillus mojavensis]UWS57807.1 hypothetical protein N1207_02755 [Bacillus subtilis]WCL62499.1 hypothetical protein PNF29_18635 [Bacillus subtilis]